MKQRPRQRQRIVYVEREQPQQQQKEQQEFEVKVEAKETQPALTKVTNSQNNKESKAKQTSGHIMLSCGVAHKNSHQHTHQYTLRAIQHPQDDGESLTGIGEHCQRLQHNRFFFSFSVAL